MSITYSRSAARTALGLIATLALVLAFVATASPVAADGDDSPAACETAINVNGGGDETSYTATGENVVTGVCIKTGEAAFDGAKHSGLLTEDGTYGDGCYEVSGIGTATVTVTEVGGSECHEVSHLDVAVGTAPSDEPSEEPSEEASQAESDEPSPSETGGVAGGNPTPTPGTIPDTALGQFGQLPAILLSLVMLGALSALVATRLGAARQR